MVDTGLRKKRHSVWRVIRSILIVVVALLLATVIFHWTRSLQAKDDLATQRRVLAEVLRTHGEAGLLEMAGISVNNIFYGDNGVTLFQGDVAMYRYSADELQNISVYELANQSVVHITTVSDASVNTFLEILPVQGTGSGIIISQDGYILTNAPVVNGAAKLSIRLYDESNHAASLIGVDQENDLAVLKIKVPEKTKLQPIKFGTATTLKVGQKVVAIGNPFGYDRTMTIGNISGLGRPVRTDANTVINGMIQTDAAINPGNSGGPLLNGRGEMVGICTTIHTTTGGFQGVGFAIPVDTAISVIPDLIRYGKVVRGWLDITMVQLDSSIIEYASLPVASGILISQVVSGGLSEKGGLRGGTQKVQYGSSIIFVGGDVIVAVNGAKVSEYSDLYSALISTHPGDKVPVTVMRKGELKTFQIELVARPEKLEWTVR
jgi:S1-C subfamily serine protease